MNYSKDQTDELKRYCSRLSSFTEGGIIYFMLEALRLPKDCNPEICDALLCPMEISGYRSRLFLSVQVQSPFMRNWNVTNQRIGERNWFAFSWKVQLDNPTLMQMLQSHLTGFTQEK